MFWLSGNHFSNRIILIPHLSGQPSCISNLTSTTVWQDHSIHTPQTWTSTTQQSTTLKTALDACSLRISSSECSPDTTETKKVQEAGRVRTLGWHYNVYNSHAHPHWYYWVLSEAPTAADTEGQKESLFRAPFLPFFCHYYQRWQLFDLTQLLLRILRTTGYFL